MTKRGAFLVLDGLDGCGKSTQARLLAERLRGMGRTVLHTREPGGTSLGEQVRRLLLDPELGEVAPLAEVFLYQASRAQLVETVIRPALSQGTDVVCERWHYSTRAYQGAYEGVGRRTTEDEVRATSELATGGLEPDRAVLLDIAVNEAGARMGADLDRVESRGAAYRAVVGERFRAIFAEDATERRIVSADGTIEAVAETVWGAIRDLFD